MSIQIDHQLRFLFAGLAVFCLAFTVTNFLPFSALMVFLSPFVVVWFTMNRKISTLLFSVILMLSYFVLNTLLYMPSSFLSYDFYRRDGNVFISFLPLLLYAPIALKLDLDRLIEVFLYWAASLTVFLIFTYSLLGLNVDVIGCHHFLFYAHNAAGGFFSIVASIALGYYLHTHSKRHLLLTGLLLMALVLTRSRGSLLGFMMAFVTSVVFKEKFNRWFVFGVFVVFVLIMSQAYPLWMKMGQPHNVFNYEYLPDGTERAGTILDRVLIVWPQAVHLWLKSPILGTGFGSFNDAPHNLQGIENLYMINDVAKPHFDSGHAHHSYFHVLAETGVVGLSLLLFFLVNLHRFLMSLESSSLRRGMLIAFWTVVWSSLTEHRLFTPSQMLPFMIILGLMLAVLNWQKEDGRDNQLKLIT
jgi:O-antigen ligase